MPNINNGSMSVMADDLRVDENNGTMNTMSGDTRVRTNRGVVNTMSGDNRVDENHGIVSTMSGDNIGETNFSTGKITTMSGDIRYQKNQGFAETKSGDIKVRINEGILITLSGTLQTELPPIKTTLQRVGGIMNSSNIQISGNSNVVMINGRTYVNGTEIGGNGNNDKGKLKINDLELDFSTSQVKICSFGNVSTGSIKDRTPLRFGEYMIMKDGDKVVVQYKDQAILCDSNIGKVAQISLSQMQNFQTAFDEWTEPGQKSQNTLGNVQKISGNVRNFTF